MKPNSARAGRRSRILKVAGALLALAFLLFLPRFYRWGLAAALVIDTLKANEITFLSHLGPDPVRFSTQVPGLGGPVAADLYLPGEGFPRRAMLLIHGVNETGKDDARIIALASNLARTRTAVLVPDFPNFRHLQIGSSDVVAVVEATSALVERFPELCRLGHAHGCGLFSFSYGVGPALIAAADPRVRDRIGFVVAFGGYADLTEVIRFVTTGQASDPRVKAVPFPWAKWVFLAANASLVRNELDRRLLGEIAQRKLNDPKADVQTLADKLESEGQALWLLMTNRDPHQTETLIAGLSPAIQEQIEALSPLSRIPNIQARLLLIHGASDRSIPFTESERIAAAAPNRASLTITRIFTHVDLLTPERGGFRSTWRYAIEAWRLIAFADELLAQRGREAIDAELAE